MGALGIVMLLYTVAALLLIAEIFIPSHGILTIAGMAFLIGAIVKTFAYGNTAGAVSIVISAIALPALAITAVKMWPNTWIGRRIAPPNPVLTEKDIAGNVVELEALVGNTGRSLTPLRPVGTCEFLGRRIQCVAESGMIETGIGVQAVGVRGANLEVIPTDAHATS